RYRDALAGFQSRGTAARHSRFPTQGAALRRAFRPASGRGAPARGRSRRRSGDRRDRCLVVMKRVVTALFLVPIAVYAALFAPWWILFAVVAIVAILCFREYASITGSFAPLGYVAGILILAV